MYLIKPQVIPAIIIIRVYALCKSSFLNKKHVLFKLISVGNAITVEVGCDTVCFGNKFKWENILKSFDHILVKEEKRKRIWSKEKNLVKP